MRFRPFPPALLCLLGLGCSTGIESEPATNPVASAQVQGSFHNPVAAIGADPWVTQHNGTYYYCFSDGDSSIYVAKTNKLHELALAPATRVWSAPSGQPYSRETWAPELHHLDGKWYIYFAASDGNNGNHRMFVLESLSQDPQGEFYFKGALTPATERWAIDGTVLSANGSKRYFIWSGWDGSQNTQQNLYIAPMTTPWALETKVPFVNRYEAENARTNHAKSRYDQHASGIAAVGWIDYEDSAVDFDVEVPSYGTYALDIHFANGTNENSSHKLSVNGSAPWEARYEPTGWGNWQTLTVNVELASGKNQLTFSKGRNFAELDYVEVKSSGVDRVSISSPTMQWERRGGPPFVSEGPAVLNKDGKVHIIYSASGSWTDDYCLGQLTFLGGDPMLRSAWAKTGPVFERSGDVFGPGHASFTKSPDGTEDWIVYHAAKSQGSGWDRNIRIQPFGWDILGSPVFGSPVPTTTPLRLPSGTH